MGIKSKFFVDVMCLSEEVTGSCHLCVVKLPNGETIKFIVDCGLFQESEYNKYNDTFPFNPDELSFVLVTHNHTDHIGRLPLLAKLGFDKAVYATKLTQNLMPESLRDTCKILGQVAKRNHTKALYGESDLNTILSHTKGIEYLTDIQAHENVTVKFLDNGHLPGAAMIFVTVSYPNEEDIHLLFTGDYSNRSTFCNVMDIPSYIFDLPITVVQESTYATTHSDTIAHVYEENVLKAISEGKTVITTVFSLGRAQELMLRDIRIYLCVVQICSKMRQKSLYRTTLIS